MAISNTEAVRRKGFNEDTHALVLSSQQHACAICATPFSAMAAKAVHADHNHQTGEARGVLCHHCNVGLGVFKDSPALLAAAASYLQNPPMKEIAMLEPKVDDLKAAVEANTNAIRELIAAIKAGVPTTAAQVAAVVTEAKPTTAAKETAAKKTTPAEKVEPAPTQPTAEAGAAAAPEKKDEPSKQADTPSYQDTANAVIKLAREKGRDAAVAVLAKFGASKLPDVKPEQFAAVIAECNAIGTISHE